MKVKLSQIDSLILLILIFILAIDSFNGILLRFSDNLLSLSLAVKTLLIILMSFRVVSYNKTFRNLFLIFALLLLLQSFYYVIILDFNRFFNFTILIKLLFFPYVLIYFYSLRENREIKFEKFKRKFLEVSFWIIAINIMLGAIGIGFSQYSNKYGTVGFFYAGNELSALMILVFAHKLYYAYRESIIKFLFFSFLVLFISIFKVTKSALFGSFILIVLIPYLSSSPNILALNMKRLKFIGLFLFVLPIMTYYAYFFILKTQILDRVLYFYHKYNLLTFLLSSRDKILNDAFEVWHSKFSILQKIFGATPAGFLNLMVDSYKHTYTVEMDFFDLFFHYGVLGILYFFFWLGLVYRSYKEYQVNIDYLPNFVAALLLFFISFISGHVVYSGMLSVFLAVNFVFPRGSRLLPNR